MRLDAYLNFYFQSWSRKVVIFYLRFEFIETKLKE